MLQRGGGLLPFRAVAGCGGQAPEYFSDACHSMRAHVGTFNTAAGRQWGGVMEMRSI